MFKKFLALTTATAIITTFTASNFAAAENAKAEELREIIRSNIITI